jgi:hypothetical protein
MGLCEEKEKYDDRLCACSGVSHVKKQTRLLNEASFNIILTLI